MSSSSSARKNDAATSYKLDAAAAALLDGKPLYTATRIVEWTDVAYYVFFRVTCVATLITSVIIAAERAL